MTAEFIHLLKWLIEFAVIFGVIFIALRWLAGFIPEPIGRVVLLIVAAIGILILIDHLIPLLAHL